MWKLHALGTDDGDDAGIEAYIKFEFKARSTDRFGCSRLPCLEIEALVVAICYLRGDWQCRCILKQR